MPIVLYHFLSSPPCIAVRLTAENLGIDLDLKHVDLFAGEQNKPEFLAMNPQHCAPTIDDDGFYLWESRAIMTYLVNKYAPHSPLYPKDPKKRAAVDRMLFFDLGTLNKTRAEYTRPIVFQGLPPDPVKEEEFKKALQLLETFLGKTKYVAGDHLTLADYSIVGTLSSAVQVADYSLAPYPKISAWMEKMKEEIPNFRELVIVPHKKFKELMESRRK